MEDQSISQLDRQGSVNPNARLCPRCLGVGLLPKSRIAAMCEGVTYFFICLMSIIGIIVTYNVFTWILYSRGD